MRRDAFTSALILAAFAIPALIAATPSAPLFALLGPALLAIRAAARA